MSDPHRSTDLPTNPEPTGSEIAIVGVAAHLPGAPDVRTFWKNLEQGVESIRRLTREELRANGAPDELIDDPRHVPVAALLADFDRFDAEFFGLGPREAAIMDPQHRHFLEATWEALEDAGHVPERFEGPIGVFAGCGMGTYFANNLLRNKKMLTEVGLFLLRHTGNDKDFLATRASYVFDLKGPSVNVQTACSTSLVAVHQAAQSLLSHECDLALAGGVTIELPHGHGYLHQEGEILSPDGHVHAFDRRAKGTVFGSGVGVVALRRLDDALADGDHVYAVVRGSAINNDGADKAGYLAPSVDGQAAAIAEALAVADVTADEVDYVECHGTGTAIGDPIEIAALTQAFRETTDAVGTCAIGSVKTNIGHLDTAAGAAALIKVARSLETGVLPASLGYDEANPTIDFAKSPFFVNASTRTLQPKGRPWRAGVTSLGVGGTNAHVLLEQAPARTPGTPSKRARQPLLISARSAGALDEQCARLADHLAGDEPFELADAAWTLAVGRRAFEHRRVVVASSRTEAATILRAGAAGRVHTHRCGDRPADVCFLFAGGGAQHVDMGRDLFESDATFRKWMARGFEWLADRGLDLCAVLYPASGAEHEACARELERPSVQLPALFLVEYALAQVWMERGVRPAALLGHSMGENTAACLAGVMAFEDALGLVHLRGRLFEQVAPGGMLSVAASEDEVRALLPDALDVACVNARDLCVVSGPKDALAAFAATLAANDVECQRIAIDIAAHSRLLEPILAQFRTYVRGLRLAPPDIPIVSNVTGRPLSDSEATDPEYWVRHLRSTVRFADGVAELAASEHRVLLEVGPGRVLGSLARAGLSEAKHQHAIHSLRHADEDVGDDVALDTAHARLWATGAVADAASFWEGETRRRVSLPTYAFQRRRYWIDADPVVEDGSQVARIDDPARYFTRRVWHRSPLPTAARDWKEHQVLVMCDAGGVGEEVARRLRAEGASVTQVVAGDAYARIDEERYALAPEHGREGFDLLVRDLVANGRRPRTVVHLWPLSRSREHRPGSNPFHEAIERGFYTLFFLGQALIAEQATEDVEIVTVTNGAVSVDGEGVASPAKALALGAIRTLPRELPGARARLLDVELSERRPSSRWFARGGSEHEQIERVAGEVLTELAGGASNGIYASRAGERHAEVLVPAGLARADAFTPRPGGAYLVTGGLGGIGLALARRLTELDDVRLVLLGRSALPEREAWDVWIAAHGEADATSQRIAAVRELEASGARVLTVAADVTDPESLERALVRARDAFGALDGVFHAAGIVDDGLLASRAVHAVECVLAPKVHGTVALDRALREVYGRDGQPRFFVGFSSTSAQIGAAGQIDYAAANAFLDAWAERRASNAEPVRDFETAVAWGIWRDVGMAARAVSGGSTDDTGMRKGLARHPLFETRTSDADGRHVLGGRLSTKHMWVLDDHRTREGDALLPGTGSFELLGGALREIGEVGAFTVLDLTFFRALYVPDDAEVFVRVVLQPDPAGYRAEVHSRISAADDWQRHTTATLALRRIRSADAVDLDALVARTDVVERGTEPLAGRQEAHLRFGPRWRVLREVRRVGDTMLARLGLASDVARDLEEWPLHPGLLDLATGFAMDLVPGYRPEDGLWVPVSYERVVVHAPLESEVWSIARPASGSGEHAGEFAFDVDVVARDGRVLVQVRGFAIHRLDGVFRPRDLPPPRASELVEDETWSARASGAAASAELDRRVRQGLRVDEGMDALWRILGEGTAAHTFVSTLDLGQLVAEAGRRTAAEDDTADRFERPELDAAYVEPRDDVERTIVELFQDILGVDRVGVHDNFFDLGGHSLVAVRLFARIKKTFGVDQPMSVLFEAPTPASQAELVRALAPGDDETPGLAARSDRKTRRYVHLVPMHGSSGRAASEVRTPFFLVAGMFGNVLNLRHLASLVGDGRPFYGLQARGLFGDLEPHETFEEAARDYLAEVREVQPEGPYLLGGFSGGGLTAYEMAQQLTAAGDEVAAVVLLDTPLAYRDPIDALDKLHIHVQRAMDRGPGYALEWLRDRLAWSAEQRRKASGPEGPDASDGGRFHDEAIEAAFRRALRRYETRDYGGRVHLFRPPLPVRYRLRGGRRANEWREIVHDDNGWRRHVRDLVVREVPGDHDSMVLEPNVRALAGHLRRVLEEAEREAHAERGAPFLRRTG